jgi:hypothetical protein
MPAERVSMRRVREILRLKYETGASDRKHTVRTVGHPPLFPEISRASGSPQ